MKRVSSFINQAEWQLKTFMVMSLSTAFCIVLVAFRIYYSDIEYSSLRSVDDIIATRGFTFMFLVWNLFLAWVPYWIAVSVEGFYKLSQSKLLAFGLIGTWLLFFPNAPYIITDLLHLHNRYPIPFWYDLMLIMSFAWTGLLLGLISLHEIRIFIKKIYSVRISWFFTLGAVVLCAFGIYLGRCLRWNSWDALMNPLSLCQDIMLSLTDSMALKITLVFSVFLMLGYLTLNVLIEKKEV